MIVSRVLSGICSVGNEVCPIRPFDVAQMCVCHVKLHSRLSGMHNLSGVGGALVVIAS
jgi:hypothetical protein